MSMNNQLNKTNMKTSEEIEQLAELYVWGGIYLTKQEKQQTEIAYMTGYTQCQEDLADERKMIMETLLKIRDCKDYGNNSSTLAKELINSLNKQD